MQKQNKVSLLTPELKARFKEIGTQETSDPLIVTKFFNPCGSETWYISEYHEERNICYGYVTGMWEDEWGFISLDELESIRTVQMKLPIERDLYFHEIKFSELMKKKWL